LCRVLLYLGWTFLLLPIQAVVLSLGLKWARSIPRYYHRICCSIIGLKLEVRGTMAGDGPVLFISNHTSYIDISVLGAVISGSFVAKAEVRKWPLYGTLARLQRTVFVERQAARQAARQRDLIAGRLADGDNLILFPEGTSNDGNRILPFKSALFSVAQAEIDSRPVTVQPISIAYTRLDGMPMGRNLRPLVAWYGDMELGYHLWRMLGLGALTVVVEFHAPVSIAEFGSRKALAEHCHKVISHGLADALSGRASHAPAFESETAALTG
jgi:1-acyl-sn-glycerol-3-phosphate acyltransferase